MSKNTSIQICRGIAAVVVVFHHLFFMQAEKLFTNEPFMKMINFHLIGDYAVYVFFAISGYVMMLSISERPKKPIIFLADRVKRIYPTYMFWTLISLIIVSSSDYFGVEIIRMNYIPGSLSELVRILFLIPSSDSHRYATTLSTAWSLVYEMYYYFIFAIIFIFIKAKKIPFILFAFLFFSSLIITSSLNPVRTSWINGSYILGDSASLCFGFGAICYSLKEKISSITSNSTMIIVALLSVFSLLLMKNQDSTKALVIILACLTFISFANIKFNEGPITKAFTFLGDASYSIYLTHILFSLASWRAAMIDKDLFVSFMFSLLSIIFGIFSYLTIEKGFISLMRKNKKVNRLLTQPK